MNGWYVLIAVCLWCCWLAYKDDIDFTSSLLHRISIFVSGLLLITASIYFIINPIKLGTYTKNSLDYWDNNLKQVYKEYKCEGIFFVEDDCEIIYQKTTYYVLKEVDSQVNLDVRSK